MLAVPATDAFDALGGGSPWHGLRVVDEAALRDLIRRRGAFHPRSAMEADETWKQVIPYPVLRDGSAWFLMRRTRAGGDVRLHDRWSIGVGGHVNPGDDAESGDLSGALRREWLEELVVDFVPPFRLVGALNDDTTSVGRVHLGVVYEADAGGRPVAIRETEKLAGAFVPTGRVAEVADDLETWSRIAFDALRTDAAVR